MKKLLPSLELENLIFQKNFTDALAYINNFYDINQKCIVYVKKDVGTNFNDYHQHNVYEIIYVEEGEIEYSIDNTTYVAQSGDFLLIPPNTSHKLIKINKHSTKRIILLFEGDYIKQFNTSKTDLSLIFENVKSNGNHLIKIRSAFKSRVDSN